MTGWLLVGWLAAALLATPLRLEATAGITEQLSGQACLHIWGVPVRWSFRTSQADGRLHMLVRRWTLLGRRLCWGRCCAPIMRESC